MTTKNYYPQIDTLRTFAALGVINLHWLGQNYLSLFGIDVSYHWGFGMFGVQLFFVLSGFLITEILINSKERNKKKSKTIINFFIRRALRLFPIYYLLIIYLILIKDQFVIENLAWYLTYTVNIKFYLEGGLIDIWSNHFWTLSIEEQFYLLFPSIILFVSRKTEYFLPLAFIAIAVGVKHFWNPHDDSVFLLTIAQTDMLGIGILIALVKNRHEELYLKLSSKRMDVPVLLLLITTIVAYYFFIDKPVIAAIFPYLLLFTFGFLVLKTTSGFSGIMGTIMENKALRYLGKISYGLYLYHKVIPLSLVLILNKLNIHIESVLVYYIINFAILILVSHLSWVIIETPLLKLKSRFEINGQKTTSGIKE